MLYTLWGSFGIYGFKEMISETHCGFYFSFDPSMDVIFDGLVWPCVDAIIGAGPMQHSARIAATDSMLFRWGCFGTLVDGWYSQCCSGLLEPTLLNEDASIPFPTPCEF